MRVPLDRSGAPFLVVVGLVTAVAYAIGAPFVAAAGIITFAFLLLFFRDPDRAVPLVAHNAVLAAADGRVVEAGDTEGPRGIPCKVVRVFLSPFNVHVNRLSVSGAVQHVEYVNGRFLPTWLQGPLSTNAHYDLWIDADGAQVVQRQIAGTVVRRIECRLVPGQRVTAGERYGIMKFGSRLDIFLPQASTIVVKKGDRVAAGQTVIGWLPVA